MNPINTRPYISQHDSIDTSLYIADDNLSPLPKGCPLDKMLNDVRFVEIAKDPQAFADCLEAYRGLIKVPSVPLNEEHEKIQFLHCLSLALWSHWYHDWFDNWYYNWEGFSKNLQKYQNNKFLQPTYDWFMDSF